MWLAEVINWGWRAAELGGDAEKGDFLVPGTKCREPRACQRAELYQRTEFVSN